MPETEPKPTGRTIYVLVRKFMLGGKTFDNSVKATEALVFGYELTDKARAVLVQALNRAGLR